MKQKMIARAIALALAFPAATLLAAPVSLLKADSLLAVDSNRAAVIDGIVTKWGTALEKSGVTRDDLRETLQGMRADQLLAASLAGSLSGFYETLESALPADTHPQTKAVMKMLGQAGADDVYTPVTPCRLVETRGTFQAVYQGDGSPAHTAVPFGSNQIRSYAVQGANGACLSQLPSGLNPSAVQLQVFAMPTTSASGDVEILPHQSAFGGTATMVYIGNIAFNTVSTIAKIDPATNQIDVQVRGGGANIALDVVGYFAPATGFVASVTPGTGVSITGTATDPIISVTAGAGATGATGPMGPAGANGVPGTAGPQGATGPAGLQGPTGPAGVDGGAGTKGVDGRTVLSGPHTPDDTNDGMDGDFYLDTTSAPFTIYGPKGRNSAGQWPTPGVSLSGPAGATGATGVAGATGSPGATGATGPQGIQGIQGNQGPTGAPGTAGATGSTGATGATGPAGPGTGSVLPISLQTGNYTLVSTDYTVLCGNPGGNPKTMTLPAASANNQKVFVIKRTGAAACDVAGVGSADGGPTVALDSPGSGTSAIMVQSDGTSWWIISRTK